MGFNFGGRLRLSLLFFAYIRWVRWADGAAEQKLIIELGRNRGTTESTQNRFGEVVRGRLPYRYRGETLPDTMDELRTLILETDHLLSARINSLSRRVERLEANQNPLRYKQQTTEWTALSVDKRVRPFASPKGTWLEAEKICKEQTNAGTLLLIDSEEENKRIGELLHRLHIDDGGTPLPSTLYWIGAQAIASYEMPTGAYNNFDKPNNESGAMANYSDSVRHERHGCAALSAQSEGKWLSRDCSEEHSFICQS